MLDRNILWTRERATSWRHNVVTSSRFCDVIKFVERILCSTDFCFFMVILVDTMHTSMPAFLKIRFTSWDINIVSMVTFVTPCFPRFFPLRCSLSLCFSRYRQKQAWKSRYTYCALPEAFSGWYKWWNVRGIFLIANIFGFEIRAFKVFSSVYLCHLLYDFHYKHTYYYMMYIE